MSQIEVEQEAVSPSKRPHLQIQTRLSNQYSDPSKSQVWLQYSQYNIKTPTNIKFPAPNTSEYIQFPNNIFEQTGKSEYNRSSQKNSQYLQVNETDNIAPKNQSKHEIVSELEISEEQKNEILGRQKREREEGEERGSIYEVKDSFKSRSSYEQRDIQINKRKFVLDAPKTKNQPKLSQGCSCSLM